MTRRLQVAIGEIRVRAASGLDARRLADRFPLALDRALAAVVATGAPPPLTSTAAPADRAAHAVAAEIASRLERPR